MRAIAALAADTLRRSLTACVVLVVAYSLSPAAVTQLHVNPVASGSVRGVYRFSSTAWSTEIPTRWPSHQTTLGAEPGAPGTT